MTNLIKENRPKKVVEIGVAAGGTSVLILDIQNENGNNAKLFSVDFEVKYYRNNTMKTGYLVTEFLNNNRLNIDHELKIGKYLPHFLEEIGNEINFVILDTMHSMPGEFLDLLAIFPFLGAS